MKSRYDPLNPGGGPFGYGFTTPSGPWMANRRQDRAVLLKMVNGFDGTTGSTEPDWPNTIGAEVLDGTIMWKVVALYDRGHSYKMLDWTALNNAQFINCYTEPEQRHAHIVYPGLWMSAIGGSFDIESNAIILGNSGLVSRGMAWTNPYASPNTPLIAALGADDGSQWTMILAGKGVNTSSATDVLKVLPDPLGRYWAFQTAGQITFEVAITGAPDPYGALLHPGLLVIRPLGDSGVNPASRIWVGSHISTGPDYVTKLQPTHRASDIILNSDAAPGDGRISAVPSGWINVTSGAKPTWKEFRLDYERPIVDNSGGIVEPPPRRWLVGEPPGSSLSLRGCVYTDKNGYDTEAGYTLPTVGGRADLKYNFLVKIGKGIKVFAQAGDRIGVGNQISSSGGSAECTDRTGWPTLESIGDDPIWIATSVVGTWMLT